MRELKERKVGQVRCDAEHCPDDSRQVALPDKSKQVASRAIRGWKQEVQHFSSCVDLAGGHAMIQGIAGGWNLSITQLSLAGRAGGSSEKDVIFVPVRTFRFPR